MDIRESIKTLEFIEGLIARSAQENRLIKSEHQEVLIRVRADSSPMLIYHDWLRARKTKRGTKHRKVEPYPEISLTRDQKNDYARICQAKELARENRIASRVRYERRRQEEIDAYNRDFQASIDRAEEKYPNLPMSI